MKIIDMLGQPCPMPVIEAKKSLSDPSLNSAIIKVDNITAVQNLEKMALGNNYIFVYTDNENDTFEVTIKKKEKGVYIKTPETVDTKVRVHELEADNNLVVAIGNNAMGVGSVELGQTLIKGFIYSLTELDPPPQTLIFFNSGVYLTSTAANTIEDLKKLEEKGTQILSCGTCVNYFNLGRPAVGEIADMYQITAEMAAASKLINL